MNEIDKLALTIIDEERQLEDKINGHPINPDDYELKRAIKRNCQRKVRLYFARQFEGEAMNNYAAIANKDDVYNLVKDLPKKLSLKDYEKVVVGEDFFKRIICNWQSLSYYLPTQILSIIH